MKTPTIMSLADAKFITPALSSVTYVSDSRLLEHGQEYALAAIRNKSCSSNQVHGVTGVLIFTGKHFAQTTEGPPSAVAHLMTLLASDQRQANMIVIDEHEPSEREFARWSMAYQGSSVYVSRVTERSLTGLQRGDPLAVKRLLRLMHEFGASPSIL